MKAFLSHPRLLVLPGVLLVLGCSSEETTDSGGITKFVPHAEAGADVSLKDASSEDSSLASEGSTDDVTGSSDTAFSEGTEEATHDGPLTAKEYCASTNPNYLGGSRNGNEECDDNAFQVPDPYVPLVLACYAGDQGNGIAYVASNTGPECAQAEGCCPASAGANCQEADRLFNGGNQRCQGFERCGCAGQVCPCGNAWDFIQYVSDGAGVIKIDCPAEGAVREIDLSAYAGKTLWSGSHTQTDHTGRMTESCIAKRVQ